MTPKDTRSFAVKDTANDSNLRLNALIDSMEYIFSEVKLYSDIHRWRHGRYFAVCYDLLSQYV